MNTSHCSLTTDHLQQFIFRRKTNTENCVSLSVRPLSKLLWSLCESHVRCQCTVDQYLQNKNNSVSACLYSFHLSIMGSHQIQHNVTTLNFYLRLVSLETSQLSQQRKLNMKKALREMQTLRVLAVVRFRHHLPACPSQTHKPTDRTDYNTLFRS